MSSPMEISTSEPRSVQGKWQQGPPRYQPTSSQHVDALLEQEQEKTSVITQLATPLPSIPQVSSFSQVHTLKQVKQQDRLLSWNSLCASVFHADAYKRALYRPAGCWVDIISTTPLASDLASYIYPGHDEAFIVEASLNNLGENMATKVYAKHYFIVPTSNPLNQAGDYCTEWSEDDFAYIVRNRVKLNKPVIRDDIWAFAYFKMPHDPEAEEDDELLSTISDDELEQTENSSSLMQENEKMEEHVLSEGETEDSTATGTNDHSPENVTEDEKNDSVNSMDELTDATTIKSDSSEQQVTTDNSRTISSNEVGKLAPSIESWIASAIGRDWADIDEEDQEENLTSSSYIVPTVDDIHPARPSTPTPFDEDEEELTSDLYEISAADKTTIIRPSTPTPYDQEEEDLDSGLSATSVINDINIIRPSTPTPYDQDDDEDEPVVNLPPVAPSLSAATLAPTQEEYEQEIGENSSEAANDCTEIADTFQAYENDFWNYIYAAPAGGANPDGQPCYENYKEPSGDYHALSFACYPQAFKSTTSAAVSLWAVTSNNVQHHMHGISQGKFLGVPFSRQSILTAQACKTVNPIHYDGPGELLATHIGSALQDAVIGYTHNTFLPIGRHLEEPIDPENPRVLHLPTDSHWSILTLPQTNLTAPFIFDYRNPDHALPPGLPGGHGKSRKRGAPMKPSALCNVELCYDGAEKANEATVTSVSPEPSLAPQAEVSFPSGLLEKLKAELKQELKAEFAAEIKAEIKAELKAELKEELKQELKEELLQELKTEPKHELKQDSKQDSKHGSEQDLKQDFKLESKPEPTAKFNTSITTRPPGSSFFESIVSGVTWTAAGTALLAAGVVVAVCKGLKK